MRGGHGQGRVPERAPFGKVLAGGGDLDDGIAGDDLSVQRSCRTGVPTGWRDEGWDSGSEQGSLRTDSGSCQGFPRGV